MEGGLDTLKSSAPTVSSVFYQCLLNLSKAIDILLGCWEISSPVGLVSGNIHVHVVSIGAIAGATIINISV